MDIHQLNQSLKEELLGSHIFRLSSNKPRESVDDSPSGILIKRENRLLQ